MTTHTRPRRPARKPASGAGAPTREPGGGPLKKALIKQARRARRQATKAAHVAEDMVAELGKRARRAMRNRKIKRLARRTGAVLKKAGTAAAAGAVAAGTAAVVSELVATRRRG